MLKVFNTLSGRKEDFVPVKPGRVHMYVCGPTVYDHAHVGHARAYIVYDAIVRYLRHSGFDVCYVRNITDIDDKIIRRAAEEGVPFHEIARRFIDLFRADMRDLGLLDPDVEPRATQTIAEMISMIGDLVVMGKAYASEGDVYLSVRDVEGYGKLSKKSLDDLEAGARVAPGERKRDPLDFALWKRAKPGEPFWPSPWGDGRPGWHIECSAMSRKFLGDTIDIHAGGADLIFPHHENEIAQSESATGRQFARYWLHNGFVTINTEKMSKSLGNSVTLRGLLDRFSPEALKLYIHTHHYRSPVDFSDSAIEESARALDRMYRSVMSAPGASPCGSAPGALSMGFNEAMDDDFNTAKAVGLLFEGVRDLNRLSAKAETASAAAALRDEITGAARVLGLLTLSPQEYFRVRPGTAGVDAQKVESLIAERAQARREKDFARADAVRDELRSMNVTVEDTPDGTIWRPTA